MSSTPPLLPTLFPTIFAWNNKSPKALIPKKTIHFQQQRRHPGTRAHPHHTHTETRTWRSVGAMLINCSVSDGLVSAGTCQGVRVSLLRVCACTCAEAYPQMRRWNRSADSRAKKVLKKKRIKMLRVCLCTKSQSSKCIDSSLYRARYVPKKTQRLMKEILMKKNVGMDPKIDLLKKNWFILRRCSGIVPMVQPLQHL